MCCLHSHVYVILSGLHNFVFLINSRSAFYLLIHLEMLKPGSCLIWDENHRTLWELLMLMRTRVWFAWVRPLLTFQLFFFFWNRSLIIVLIKNERRTVSNTYCIVFHWTRNLTSRNTASPQNVGASDLESMLPEKTFWLESLGPDSSACQLNWTHHKYFTSSHCFSTTDRV